MIVVDTQVLVYATTESPNRPLVQTLNSRDSTWVTSRLWRSEFRNALLGLTRTGALPQSEALDTFRRAERLLAEEHDPGTAALLDLAAGNRVTAYDLEFVTVATQLSIPLVTFDREVLAAFPAIAVHPRIFAA